MCIKWLQGAGVGVVVEVAEAEVDGQSKCDDQEALLDAQAEMADTAAALKGVGETAGAPARAPPEAPAAV